MLLLQTGRTHRVRVPDVPSVRKMPQEGTQHVQVPRTSQET
jgi:hypothetical protein